MSLYSLDYRALHPAYNSSILIQHYHIHPPIPFPSSIRIGLLNVAPPSLEKIIFTCAFLSGDVNHATARLLPMASILGPFTGHPSIFHLSANIGLGTVHLPSTNLTIDMSLILLLTCLYKPQLVHL